MPTRKPKPAPTDGPLSRPVWGIEESRESFEERLDAYVAARNAAIVAAASEATS